MTSKVLRAFALLSAMAIASLLLVVPAHGAPIVNGDFSDPINLAGWTPSGSLVHEPTGEFGQLDTDGSFMRTLDQSFTLPAVPSLLSFDFAFSTDATIAIGGFPDSFAASVITASDDFLDIVVVDLLGAVPDPSDGIEGITGATPIDVAFDDTVTIPGFMPFMGGTSYAGRIDVLLPDSVLGQDATLFFDLFDQFDGASTITAVDNVGTAARAVPAPGAFGLMFAGLIAAISTRRRRSSLS